MRMRKEEWRAAFQEAYAAPKATRKKAFLRKLPDCPMSMRGMVKSQLCYMKKWVWFVSAAVSFSIAAACRHADGETLWIVSALAPYLALVLFTEGAKSGGYRMEELELSTRFSLKNLLLARMGAVLLVQGSMAAIAAVVLWRSHVPFFRIAPYILLPFFLTTALGFAFFRSMRGRGALYAAAVLPVLVSVSMWAMRYLWERLFLWSDAAGGLITALFCVVAIREGMGYLKQMEELSWKYS